MKMQAMVALRQLDYGRPMRRIKAGEIFQASPRDARILTALKRAQIDPAGVATEVKTTITERPAKEVVTEALGMQQPAPYAAKKRSYTRRYNPET